MVDMTLLETRGLVKRYSGRAVVNQASITIGRHTIVGLLGRNGAGKTTSFRMIMGMITPDSGEVIFEGRDITKLPMYKRARLGIGYLSQEPSIFQRLSVRDNLYAILETMSITKAERNRKADMLIEGFALGEVADSQGRFLSGGERRKLEIARAMVTNPSLILLDEPFSGVDPIAVEDLQREIHRLVASGVSILITDHNVERTLEVVDRAYIIDHGKVIGAGEPAEIVRNELMLKNKGIGLAAPQVGVPLRLFIISLDGKKETAKVYINPTVTPAGELNQTDEGCLSVPGVFTKIRRYKKCSVIATDLDGNEFTEEAQGLFARALQHEYDHIQGMTIANRMGSTAKIAHRRQLKKLIQEHEKKPES